MFTHFEKRFSQEPTSTTAVVAEDDYDDVDGLAWAKQV